MTLRCNKRNIAAVRTGRTLMVEYKNRIHNSLSEKCFWEIVNINPVEFSFIK